MEVVKVAAAPRAAKFEQGFRMVNFKVSPDEYNQYRAWAYKHRVTVSDVCRLALADEATWKRAAKVKAQQFKEKEGNV